MSIVTLIAEVAGRLSEARGALEPFKRFSEAMSYMGGTFPKEGAFYSIFPAATGEREIAVEDFRKASEVYSRLSGGAAQ